MTLDGADLSILAVRGGNSADVVADAPALELRDLVWARCVT